MQFKSSAVITVLISLLCTKLCSESVILWILCVFINVLTVLYAIGTYDHNYWTDRGVFSPPALPFIGHIISVITFKEQGGLCFQRIYNKYKDLRFLGTHQFFQRTLVIRDPALIRRICVNDFHHFIDRGFFFNKDVDPLAGSVLFLRGNEWRKLRAKITPIFSPNKLRGMLPIIDNTAKAFVVKMDKALSKVKNNKLDIKNQLDTDILNHNIKINNNHVGKEQLNLRNADTKREKEIDYNGNNVEREEVDLTKKDKVERSKVMDSEKLVGGYTADAIVPCAFGLKSNVMYNDKDPFAVALHAFYETSWYNLLEKTMRQFWPSFVLFFRMRIIPKKTHDFFYNIVIKVLRARESGEQEKRGDFIDMMIALRNDEKNNNTEDCDEDVEITDMVISANAFIIFLGGFETTSGTLSFLLMELAHDRRVQDKLRIEVDRILKKYQGEISYEMLSELSYMEMVINETLRLYPPFPSIQRLCTKDYVIPGTQITVESGTVVLFPTLGIQRDSQYFENADAFIPERWEEGQPVPPPGVYMPFGDGPRYCIGKRFAILQMKCFLVRVVSSCCVSPSTPVPRPFAPDPSCPLTLHPLSPQLTFTLLKGQAEEMKQPKESVNGANSKQTFM